MSPATRCDRIISLIDDCLGCPTSAPTGGEHPLYSSSLRLRVDRSLVAWCLFTAVGAGRPGAGSSQDRERWLVFLMPARSDHPDGGGVTRWLCAPASTLAIDSLLSGRALPADLFRHSLTGSVLEVDIGQDGQVAEYQLACASLAPEDLPAPSFAGRGHEVRSATASTR